MSTGYLWLRIESRDWLNLTSDQCAFYLVTDVNAAGSPYKENST